MVSDKRRSPRHNVGFRMVFDDGESYNAASVVNVSETGLFLESAKAVPLGAVVRLEPTDIVEDALFELEATVVRCSPLDLPGESETHHGLMGIGAEFINLSDEASAAIRRMIDALEAAEEKTRAAPLDPLLGVRRQPEY